MPMSDFEKAQSLLTTAEMHETGIQHNVKIQWQITFVLWAGIFAAIGFLADKKEQIDCPQKFFIIATSIAVGYMFFKYASIQFKHRVKIRDNWAKCIAQVQEIAITEKYIDIEWKAIEERRKENRFGLFFLPILVTWIFLFFLCLRVL